MARKLPKETIDLICRRYMKSESSTKLAKEFGVSATAVCNYARYRGLKKDTYHSRYDHIHHKKYSCNETFFGSINSEEKAYWLGFITADGCVTPVNELRIMLSAKDTGHLEQFKKSINATHPIKNIIHHGGSYALLCVNSKTLVCDLSKYGVVHRKTGKLAMPSISLSLMRHYIRGFFDANGTFKIHTENDKLQGISFSITSNYNFLVDIQNILINNCGANHTKIYVRKNKLASCDLSHQGRQQVKKIFDFLYQGSTFYLNRKKQKAEPYMF